MEQNLELITNQMLAEGANLLQMSEDRKISFVPKHTLRLLKEMIENFKEPFDDERVTKDVKAGSNLMDNSTSSETLERARNTVEILLDEDAAKSSGKATAGTSATGTIDPKSSPHKKRCRGSIKLTEKILIPQKQFPFINFKGYLLGMNGSILQKIESKTETKIMILGAGSMKNKTFERNFLKTGNPVYRHLDEPLHLHVIAEGPAVIAFAKMGLALKEISAILTTAITNDLPIEEKNLIEKICENMDKNSTKHDFPISWQIEKLNSA